MSRLLPIGFALAVITLGLAFSWWLWSSYRKVAPNYEWPQVEATIEQSTVETWQPTPHSPDQFRLQVRYRYEYEGEIHESERIRSRSKPYLRRDDVEADRQRWSPGATVPAWVDPNQPSRALLERDSRAVLYAIAFPVLLTAFGLVTLWRALR